MKWASQGRGADMVVARTGDSSESNNDRCTFCNNEKTTILVLVHTNGVPAARAGPVLWTPKGMDNDGDLDLLFHFER